MTEAQYSPPQSADKPVVKKEDKTPKPVFTKPTSQLDLEARLAVDNEVKPPSPPVNPSVDDSGFIGTDPIYQNRANETDQPLDADEGPDKLAEEAFRKSFVKPEQPKAPKESK